MNEQITWNYVKDGMPKSSGRYLFSYGSPEMGDPGVEIFYYNRQRKKLYSIDGRDEDGNPIELSIKPFAWAELPKGAAYE